MKSNVYSVQTLVKPFLLLLLMFFAQGLFAQATLSVQGVLTKSDGTAVDDGNDYVLTFRLWKSESGTAASDKVHEETIENISIVGGVYSVVLGLSMNPQFKLTAPFNQPYWLGVSVGTSSVELLPRPRLTHAPYALGLVGEHNIFPSTGPVIGDAFRAKGGPAQGGLGSNANGFSFQAPSGDESGGMYSDGTNIELWTGGQKRVQLNGTQNELYGQTVNFGSLVSNNFTANGNAVINNVGNNTGNLTVKNFLQVDGSAKVEGALTVTTNEFINAHATIGGNQTINGSSFTKGFNRAASWFDNSGFTFNYTLQGGPDDTDSGLFGKSDGIVQIRSNGGIVAEFSPGQGWCNNCNGPNNFIQSSVKFFGIQKGPDNPQVEWDEVTGQLQVDNSSRRLKRNILPMTDDFRLILKVQPKLYNRIGYPDSLVELGYIAEEFDSLGLTRLVHYNSRNEITGVNYKKVSIYLAEVVKVHETEIEKMKAEIAALQAENIALQKANASLQTDKAGLQTQQNAFSAQLDALSKRISAMEMSGRGTGK
ncbi:MAG: tail fiber domain-containing protein [Bacteroidota bacterium]